MNIVEKEVEKFYDKIEKAVTKAEDALREEIDKIEWELDDDSAIASVLKERIDDYFAESEERNIFYYGSKHKEAINHFIYVYNWYCDHEDNIELL